MSNIVAAGQQNALRDNNSTTVTTTPKQIVGNVRGRRFLFIQNVGAVNVGISLDGTTPSIGSAGTVTLAPNGSMTFENNTVPSGMMQAVAASGTSALTIWEM